MHMIEAKNSQEDMVRSVAVGVRLQGLYGRTRLSKQFDTALPSFAGMCVYARVHILSTHLLLLRPKLFAIPVHLSCRLVVEKVSHACLLYLRND